MTPEWSRVFLQRLCQVGLLWLLLGSVLTYRDGDAMNAFFQVYFFTGLDLAALILVFWTLFFSQLTQRAKVIRGVFFFTLKLVCLGLLAITLKRLGNAPTYAAVFGVLFMGVGPLVAGVISRFHKGNANSDAKL